MMQQADRLAAQGAAGSAAVHSAPWQEALAPGRADARITVYDSLASAEALRPEWDALLEQFPGASPFCTWEWLASWWRAYAGADRLLVLAMRDASSTLVGLAPLALTRERAAGVRLRTLRLMGDGSHDSDNLDLPVRAGCAAEFSTALLDWLERFSGWDICRLRTLPAGSPMGAALMEALRARGWKVWTAAPPHCVVQLPANWQAYLKFLSSKERGKIGLRCRRLERKYPVRLRRIADPAEVAPALAALFELHTKHWRTRGLPGSFEWPARRRFYGELAPLLLARQQLELWVLELDGTVVAAQFALRHGDTVYALQEGYEPAYSADSIGYVLRASMLKDMIERRLRQYDFLGGASESKVRWGARVEHYLSLQFARPRSAGGVLLALERMGRVLKDRARERLPEPALRMLQRLLGRRDAGA